LKVSEEEQTIDHIYQRLDKKRIEIKRLKKQLQSRLPKGRDPTGQRYLQHLTYITALPKVSDAPDKMEAELDKLTEQQQLPLFNELPYPIQFYSASDLYWSVESHDTSTASANGIHQEFSKTEKPKAKHHQRPKERICVTFKGLTDYLFKIQCGRRQLPVFRQLQLRLKSGTSR
jgi:hypothetical protein